MKKERLYSYQQNLKSVPILSQVSERICPKDMGVAKRSNAYVWAPTVLGFVGWIIRKAQKMGIQRLYFLARDGYQFYNSARKLCDIWEIPMDCRYLECSRYSLRVPMFSRLGENALDYICLGGIDVTLRKVLRRAGISETMIPQVAGQLQLEEQLEVPMSYQQVQSLKAQLKDCSLFMEEMKRISDEAYPQACAYLEQEGMLEDVPYALVDSGWTGSMQQVMQQLLHSMGYEKTLAGFYWGLYEIPREMESRYYHAYYFKTAGDYRRKVYFSNCLFEAVFGAPHGMTLSYQKVGEKMQSCYETERAENAEKIEEQMKQILSYLEALPPEVKNWTEEEFQSLAKVLFKQNRLLMGMPQKDEAEYYGNYTFTDDVLSREQRKLATDLSKPELKDNHLWNKLLHMYGVCRGAIRESAWYEASAVADVKHQKRHWRSYRRYKYLIYLRKNLQRGT